MYCSSGVSHGGLYRLNLNGCVIFQTESDNLMSRHVLSSRKLGHTTLERMKILVKDDLLPSLLNSEVLFYALRENKPKLRVRIQT